MTKAEAFQKANDAFHHRYDANQGNADNLTDDIEQLAELLKRVDEEAKRFVDQLEQENKEKWDSFMSSFLKLRQSWVLAANQYFESQGIKPPISTKHIEEKNKILNQKIKDETANLIADFFDFQPKTPASNAVSVFLDSYKEAHPID